MKKLSYLFVFAALCLISTNTYAQEVVEEALVEEAVEATDATVEEATDATVEAKKEDEVEEAVEEVENPE